jgi:hypothetical protein
MGSIGPEVTYSGPEEVAALVSAQMENYDENKEQYTHKYIHTSTHTYIQSPCIYEIQKYAHPFIFCDSKAVKDIRPVLRKSTSM